MRNLLLAEIPHEETKAGYIGRLSFVGSSGYELDQYAKLLSSSGQLSLSITIALSVCFPQKIGQPRCEVSL
jgi:hypothetical protein